MAKREIKICYPSYRRADRILTLGCIPSALGFVHEFEIRKYREENPKAQFVSVPDDLQGNVARVRNFILDYWKKKKIVLCCVDDDFKSVGYWEDGEAQIMDEDEIYNFIRKYSIVAMDLGLPLWGVQVNDDPQAYRTYMPFSFKRYVSASFSVFIDCPLRYDEDFPLKEDYDLAIMTLNLYRRILRVNRAFYSSEHQLNPGGCATYRNIGQERKQVLLLRKKWGSEIVHLDVLRTSRGKKRWEGPIRKIDVNPIIRVPIKGV